MKLCECGLPLDSLGLCPVCDDPALNPEPVPDAAFEDSLDPVLANVPWSDE